MRLNSIILTLLILMTMAFRSINALDEEISKEDESMIAHIEMLETMDVLKDENFEEVEQEEVVAE